MSARDSYLRRTYGLSLVDYELLLERQGGGCALCGKTPAEEGKNLAVDHDHKTGECRGVLCSYCNRYVIGRHRDPDLLRRMARYLEEGHTGFFAPPKKRKRRPKKAKGKE